MRFDYGFYVADVLMGGGKTTAATRYMDNAEGDEKFLYITPFEPEFSRIMNECVVRNVVTPVVKRGRKLNDLRRLLQNGNDVVSSHRLLEDYTADILDSIKQHNYTLFMDECYEVVRVLEGVERANFNSLVRDGKVEVCKITGTVQWLGGDNHSDDAFENIVNKIKTGYISCLGRDVVAWVFPIEILRSFRAVVILTYKFESNMIYYHLKSNGIKYKTIGVKKIAHREYEFCKQEDASYYIPDIESKINILDDKKLNSIGCGDTDLSANWGKKDARDNDCEKLNQLGRNIRNVQKNVFKCSARDFIWTFYNKEIPTSNGKVSQRDIVSDKNIRNGFVPCNAKGQNKWGDRHYLAYCVNMRANPQLVWYFRKLGLDVDKDGWALSLMVQWIWRSAIRNDEEIWIYVPSDRMRSLLKSWVKEVSGGGSAA